MPEIDPIPQRQLLSFKVRGPDLAAVFSELRDSGPLTDAELKERFAPPPEPRNDEMVREGLEMLRALELIQRIRPDEDTNLLYQVNMDVPPDVPFPLLILERLYTLEDGRRVFRLIHDLVISKDLLFISRHDLLVELETSFSDQDYAWNVEKVRVWRAMTEYLGLTRTAKPSAGDILISPTPVLLNQLLLAYIVRTRPLADERYTLPILEWFEFLETHYCRCYTDRGAVHQGLADALLSMDTTQRIKLKILSDAGSVRLKNRGVSHILISR